MENDEGTILDREWMELVVIAKEIGLRPDEVRGFIQQNRSWFKNDDKNDFVNDSNDLERNE